MVGTSARLLRLLSLLQSRRSWTGGALAEALEVTERTLRRDIDKLRGLGYPVNATSGVAGGYSLGPGAKLPPLLLEDDEALAVSVGLQNAASGTIRGMEEAALRALAKLEQVLPARLQRRLRSFHAAVMPLYLAGPTVDASVLSALASACRAEEVVAFGYGDRQRQQSEREVEPHGLVHSGPRWYLAAWDRTREDFRTFRVDRITGKVRVTGRFSPRPLPEGDVARYVARSISTDAYKYRGRIVLHAPRELIAERIPQAYGRVTALDEARCQLETGTNRLDALAFHVAMLGVEFEVLEPPELTEELRTLSARLGRAAGRSGQRAR
ncbi:MAG: YafY family transcriptional regulator [Myxococcales bacterium]|nr:YafY family transcriptional regulator [Myxococcales bacterium]